MISKFAGVHAFIRGEDAVTAIEYALIAMLIALVILAAVTSVGQTVRDLFDRVASSMP
ncbi:Flp family type IVb pilin [Cupriavidus sp. WKF15]|uniref:Flp family type IVb pilin n=1 Tax=Cupriavidus sp. WKF15 TaxID=3032282 RepID=UPI0023E2CC5C|nr:Flp family type IVb pilin [Cupriavidus sp. WKF15]WER46715.1 Flp family type IVb pilin [Cupriavidus sp. WKF15]